MKLIETQDKLLSTLSDDLSLVSSRLSKVCIYTQNDLLCIDIEAELMYRKENKKILLRLIDVEEYSFYYSSHRIFYNVEIYKFFKSGNLFYISFDPVDESEVISDDDQDFIKAKAVEAYFI